MKSCVVNWPIDFVNGRKDIGFVFSSKIKTKIFNEMFDNAQDCEILTGGILTRLEAVIYPSQKTKSLTRFSGTKNEIDKTNG